MSAPVSLTELRQRLFQLADQVVDSGEPLIVLRKGVRLRLMRDDTPAAPAGGKLARLKKQQAWVGPRPDPHYSPAEWSGASLPAVAESTTACAARPKAPRKRR
jgi:hypothetical protein